MPNNDDPNSIDLSDLIKTFAEIKQENEQNPKWQKNNLEWALRTSEFISKKVCNDDEYAQHLYATLCNNEFVAPDVWEILTNKTWSCSWRYAGGVVADIRKEGDYLNWYCSGCEGDIFPEIEEDLNKIGWRVVRQP